MSKLFEITENVKDESREKKKTWNVYLLNIKDGVLVTSNKTLPTSRCFHDFEDNVFEENKVIKEQLAGEKNFDRTKEALSSRHIYSDTDIGQKKNSFRYFCTHTDVTINC